jgi:RNA polymerase sigma-70 factor (ECF subfamily)
MQSADFATMYRENIDYVWRSLRRLSVQTRDLEDVAHDVFVVVHRRLGDFDASRRVRPWLFGIAHRVASDYRRAAVRRVDPQGDMNEPQWGLKDGATPESETMRRETFDAVRAALEQLDEDSRAVFILVDLDGEPVTDVAASLEIPLNTAYSRLRRARQTITNLLVSHD